MDGGGNSDRETEDNQQQRSSAASSKGGDSFGAAKIGHQGEGYHGTERRDP